MVGFDNVVGFDNQKSPALIILKTVGYDNFTLPAWMNLVMVERENLMTFD